MKIDLFAPIISGQGVGEFRLKQHVREYFEIINKNTFTGENHILTEKVKKFYLRSPFEMVFILENCIELCFNTMNGKLFTINLHSGYKGSVNNILYIDMPLEELKNFGFEYNNEFEWYCHKDIKGLSIIHDISFERVEVISVFINEMVETEDFDVMNNFKKGLW